MKNYSKTNNGKIITFFFQYSFSLKNDIITYYDTMTQEKLYKEDLNSDKERYYSYLLNCYFDENEFINHINKLEKLKIFR